MNLTIYRYLKCLILFVVANFILRISEDYLKRYIPLKNTWCTGSSVYCVTIVTTTTTTDTVTISVVVCYCDHVRQSW